MEMKLIIRIIVMIALWQGITCQKQQCGICLDDLDSENDLEIIDLFMPGNVRHFTTRAVKTTGCGHSFHSTCLASWFTNLRNNWESAHGKTMGGYGLLPNNQNDLDDVYGPCFTCPTCKQNTQSRDCRNLGSDNIEPHWLYKKKKSSSRALWSARAALTLYTIDFALLYWEEIRIFFSSPWFSCVSILPRGPYTAFNIVTLLIGTAFVLYWALCVLCHVYLMIRSCFRMSPGLSINRKFCIDITDRLSTAAILIHLNRFFQTVYQYPFSTRVALAMTLLVSTMMAITFHGIVTLFFPGLGYSGVANKTIIFYMMLEQPVLYLARVNLVKASGSVALSSWTLLCALVFTEYSMLLQIEA